MATISIPYIGVPGSMTKILEKIKEAITPDIFNADFLSTKLGFKGGNYRTFISWAKRCGLLNSDGSPTQLYKSFRNPTTSRASLAQALKTGYAELYSRNEYCHDLDKKAFKGLIMEATGEAHDSRVVELVVSTFFNSKTMADFDARLNEGAPPDLSTGAVPEGLVPDAKSSSVRLGLNYTINLVLPKTDDPAIYDAIFQSLREHLLKG